MDFFCDVLDCKPVDLVIIPNLRDTARWQEHHILLPERLNDFAHSSETIALWRNMLFALYNHLIFFNVFDKIIHKFPDFIRIRFLR